MDMGLLGAAKITPLAIVNPSRVVSNVTLQGVAARDPEKATRFAKHHGVARVFEHYSDLIQADEIDWVYNALPIHRHAHWSQLALAAGKNVLCEKPLAMNQVEARTMLDTAKVNNVRLVEAFHYRYHPSFQYLWDWLQPKPIGAIQSFEAEFCFPIQDDGYEIRYRPETGGGSMMDLGCYPLHWLLSLLDEEPVSVQAEAVIATSGVDVSMRSTFTYDSGLTASLFCAMNREPSAWMHIKGTLGEVYFKNPLAPHLGGELRLTVEDQVKQVPISRISTYTHQLAACVASQENSIPLPTEGPICLKQQQWLDRVYEAAGLGMLRQSVSDD